MYNITTLNNGLRIVSYRMPGMRSVSMGIWVKAGGRYENKSNSGISHAIEHLLFKGTKHRSAKKIKEAIEGTGGSLNGFTSEEFTCYLAKVVGKHLPLAIEVLSDMVLNPLFKTEDMEKEKAVICEEIKMYLDLPMHYVHDLLQELLWPDQPLGMLLTGTVDTVGSITRKDMLKFKQAYYNPANIVVSVCGDLETERTVAQVYKHFSKKAKGAENNFIKAKVGQKKARCNFHVKQTEQTHLCLGMHAFGRSHPDRYALSLLNIILGANMSSRLFQEIREERGLAYDINSSVDRYKETGAFVVSAGVENKNLGRTVSAIMKILKKVKKHSIGRSEFNRAKDFYTGQLLMGL